MPRFIFRNRLESERFGVECGKIDSNAELNTVNLEAGELGVKMLTTRVSTNSLGRVLELENDGYRLMDTIVFFERDACELSSGRVGANAVFIRRASFEDVSLVEEIASAAFRGYCGHYHADPMIDNLLADAVYRDWAGRAVVDSGYETPVLVACRKDRVLGFLALRRNSGKEWEVVLNAVHPDVQSQGIYTSLLDSAVRYVVDEGTQRVLISTQITNIIVQRIWAKFGFCPAYSFYTFHKWF